MSLASPLQQGHSSLALQIMYLAQMTCYSHLHREVHDSMQLGPLKPLRVLPSEIFLYVMKLQNRLFKLRMH